VHAYDPQCSSVIWSDAKKMGYLLIWQAPLSWRVTFVVSEQLKTGYSYPARDGDLTLLNGSKEAKTKKYPRAT
jgi:hypothetical protein